MTKWVLIFGLVLSFNAMADELTCAGDENSTCQWQYDENTHTLTITGTGKMKDYGVNTHIPDFSIYTPQRPWDSIASEVEHIEVSGLTSVGNCAFVNMSNVKTVDIADTVNKIEGYAFYNLNKVTSLNIPDSVTSIEYAALYGMQGLTELNIPNSVTSIGDYAFRWVSGVTNLSIPDSVTEVGEYAFSVMGNLKSITIGDEVTSIEKGSFAQIDNLEKIYCQGEERCRQLIEAHNSSKVDKLVIFEKTDEGVYILDGLNYASSEDMMVGTTKSCGTISQCREKIEQNREAKALAMSGGTLCADQTSCLNLINMAEAGTNCHTVASCYAWLYRQEENPDGSFSIYENGKFARFKNKRIYTIEEANRVAGEKNRVSIKYR